MRNWTLWKASKLVAIDPVLPAGFKFVTGTPTADEAPADTAVLATLSVVAPSEDAVEPPEFKVAPTFTNGFDCARSDGTSTCSTAVDHSFDRWRRSAPLAALANSPSTVSVSVLSTLVSMAWVAIENGNSKIGQTTIFLRSVSRYMCIGSWAASSARPMRAMSLCAWDTRSACVSPV